MGRAAGVRAACASTGVKFSEDLAGVISNGDVTDTLPVELVEVVEEGRSGHGGKEIMEGKKFPA